MSEYPALKQILEGAILAADKPLNLDNLTSLFGEQAPDRNLIKEALAEIESDCEGRGFELKKVASGYRFQVRSEYGDYVDRLWEERAPRYTRAFLETLALIAYKQPITRGDIEEIRGVTVSTNIMRSLMEREWVRVVGHRDVPGRPAIYATTKTFLDYFDLSSLDELPTLSEIKDLDKMNEELDLDEELITPRSIDLGIEEEDINIDGADDETLSQITDKVNTIQENIKNLFKEPQEDDLTDDEDDLEETLESQAETSLPADESSGTANAEPEEDGLIEVIVDTEVSESDTNDDDDDDDDDDDTVDTKPTLNNKVDPRV
tara:strand:- start:12838 stop:13794 length:957 start_codon:yes stop_codon:yes gene_type:complete